MVTEVVRGSTIIWAVVFKDQAGEVVNPAAATLYVRYRDAGVIAQATITMTEGPSSWMASWDSSVADGGRADWHIRSDGTNKAGLEGKLQLKINTANPVPA
jgi:hypothetical protein